VQIPEVGTHAYAPASTHIIDLNFCTCMAGDTGLIGRIHQRIVLSPLYQPLMGMKTYHFMTLKTTDIFIHSVMTGCTLKVPVVGTTLNLGINIIMAVLTGPISLIY